MLKRRELLCALGASVSVAGSNATDRESDSSVETRIWLTEAAAEYDALPERVVSSLEQAFGAAGLTANVTVSGRRPRFQRESPSLVRRTTWPLTVQSGQRPGGPMSTAADINLLVTDEDPTGAFAGYTRGTAVAVAGARYIAEMPQAAIGETVVAYSTPAVLTQLVVHECGHALGLSHRHGTVEVSDAVATVSPMVSGYAWASDAVRRRHLPSATNACGRSFHRVGTHRRRLSMVYSPCGAAAITEK